METYRIQEDGALYYLTFTVVHWLPVFVSSEPCLILTESLNYCHQQKGLVHDATDWRFSSAAYWLNDEAEASDVQLTGVTW